MELKAAYKLILLTYSWKGKHPDVYEVCSSMNRKNNNQNPWLFIPASDYEAHMGSNGVGQLSVLNSIFKDVLQDIRPRSMAVLGCGTGNGFEHINPQITQKVLGIDINPKYLKILHKRHGDRFPGLELACSDLYIITYPDHSFNLIHAALVFEYVDIEKMLNKVSRWLTKGGVLSVVLQLPNPKLEMISKTRYTSLKSLESIMHLVDPIAFNGAAERYGLYKSKETEIPLKSGKKFLLSYYRSSS